MTTPIGSISMADIAAEFGGIPPHTLREYKGVDDGVPASGSIDFDSLRGKEPGSIISEYDLRTTTPPTGLSYNPGSAGLQTEFASDGYRTAGDGTGTSYELHTSNTYDGDVLFEASVLVTNNCGDPGIAISPNIGDANWFWGAHYSRIALQFNCQRPTLYGYSLVKDVGTNITNWGSGTYYTLHLWHRQSIGQTWAWVTKALNDWHHENSSLRIGNVTIINNYFSVPVGFGVASDYDYTSVGPTSTNFQRMRVATEMNNNLW
jgi:hypothetical protein